MNVLIDIGHPAHVHLFRNFAHIMEDKGHQVLFTCRDKEYEIALLEANGFHYCSFGKKYSSIIGKIFGMLKFDYMEWKACRKFKPDILLSHGSMYAAQVAALLRKPHISFEDTYNMEQIRLYRPFTDLILTGNYVHPILSSVKEFNIAGFHALAYLHPNRFSPDESVLEELGVKKGEKYVVIRFIAWNASHDIGHKGITKEIKMKAVCEFAKIARVFISSEDILPNEFDKYRLPTRPNRIHDVMSFASLVFGESSTMSEEAAMLGIPSVYIDSDSRYYTKHIESTYQLIYNLSESEEDQQKAIQIGLDILEHNDPQRWQERKEKLLQDKIDVTAFLEWLVENYPESKRILKENSNYQYRFK